MTVERSEQEEGFLRTIRVDEIQVKRRLAPAQKEEDRNKDHKHNEEDFSATAGSGFIFDYRNWKSKLEIGTGNSRRISSLTLGQIRKPDLEQRRLRAEFRVSSSPFSSLPARASR